jgi:hypothetical protein
VMDDAHRGLSGELPMMPAEARNVPRPDQSRDFVSR